MASRHRAREIAFQFLYRYDHEVDFETIEMDLDTHFNHFKIEPSLRSFSRQLVRGAIENRPELDALIESTAENWTIKRISSVDRNLLRLALYEIRNCEETPASVAINESIEMAKSFGTADSSGFVNGILDRVAKSTAAIPSPMATAPPPSIDPSVETAASLPS